ncbi:MAG: molybdopterin-dependent oxidoreductase, partial [Acidimicrobiia bacterium]|nr:molybdopterin-dependent oxidoreductase [Acidimicrobiia bacterium]
MIGESIKRPDAEAKVTGAAIYPGDIRESEMLTAVVVFSDQPHARMTSMDTSRAAELDGVVTIVTAADVPLNEYGLTMFDQPVLVGVDGTGRSNVPSDISRWEADHIAVVVAETDAIARQAADLIDVQWQELPLAADVDTALAPDAPLIHPENGKPTNAYYQYVFRKGDMEQGWAQAEVVVEGTYQLPHQEHAYLQPEAAVAYV